MSYRSRFVPSAAGINKVGSTWHSGVGPPAPSFGLATDWYLDKVVGDIYEKTGASTWTKQFGYAVRSYDSRAGAQAANLPASVNWLLLAGYYTPGDGGDAMYKRIATPFPVKPWHLQSADGAWWQLVEFEVTVRHFGAVPDATIDATTGYITSFGTDNTTFFQAAIDFAKALGTGLVVIPRGNYGFHYTSGNMGPLFGEVGCLNIEGGGLRFVGDGMDESILCLQTSTTVDDFANPFGLFMRGIPDDDSSRAWWKPISFAHMQFRMPWGQAPYTPLISNPEAGPRPLDLVMLLEKVEAIHFSHVKWKNIVLLCTLFEVVKDVRFEDCVFDTSVRDGVHVRNGRNVFVSRCHFMHSDDNPIAIGNTEYRERPEEVSETVTITDCIFEDTQAISISAARQLVYSNNHHKRVAGGIYVTQFGTAAGQGSLDAENFSCIITNNTFLDTLRRSWNAPDAFNAPMSIQGVRYAANAGVVPGFVNPTTGLTELPYAYRNVRSPSGGGYNYMITGNIVARTLAPVAHYSDWGFGKRFDPIGFSDQAVTETELRPSVALYIEAAIRNCLVEDNIFANARGGILIQNRENFSYLNFTIRNNTIFDIVNPADTSGATGIGWSGADTPGDFLIEGNVIDMDPYYLSPRRVAFGSGRGPTWNSTLTNPTVGIAPGAANGVRGFNNHFKNCSYAILDFAANSWEQSVLYCDFTAGGAVVRGVGNALQSGAYDPRYVLLDLDFASGNFGKPKAQMLKTANGMPSSGLYAAGHVVFNTNVGLGVVGWQRLTTGTAHVLTVDWKAF